MSDELQQYYKAKAKSKNPKLFDYDDDGNLVERNKEGAVIKTIAIPSYRHPTYEEFDEMEHKRMELIALAEKEYEDAREELRQLIQRPDTVDSDILRINRKVTETDVKLQAVRFPLRYINKVDGVEIRKIDFTQINEKRKLPYRIAILESRPFTLHDQYVRIGAAPVKPMISVAEIKAKIDDSIPIILFSEPETNDYGVLTLKWTVDLEFNSTMYNSAQQAIYAELAKSFNDENNLNKIMIAETPDAINYKLTDVPGDAEVNGVKWNDKIKQLLLDVNLAKFNQFPELTARLLETKNAKLGAYEPDDNLIGIGISLDNINSKNPVFWTGQNILGKALMDIRDKIRTERAQLPSLSVGVPRPVRRRPVVVGTFS